MKVVEKIGHWVDENGARANLETENYIYKNGSRIEKVARTNYSESRYFVDVFEFQFKGLTNLTEIIDEMAHEYGLWLPKRTAYKVRRKYLSRIFIAGYISALRRIKSGCIDIDSELNSLISPTEVDVTKCY